MYGRARAIEATAETVEEAPITAAPGRGLTVGELQDALEDARLTFFHLLGRRFGREYKERHGEDLFAQAAYEFSRKLDHGEEIANPAAWLMTCAWNRAKDERRSRDSRPQLVSTESLLFEPVAERSWEPEEAFAGEERWRRVREAVEELPVQERELVARHHFEEESLREASRHMGLSQSKGSRAYRKAAAHLRLVLGDLEAPGLRVEIGAAAFLSVSAAGRAAAADVPAGFEAALHRVGHAVSDGWRRAADLVRHPLGGGRTAEVAGATPQGTGRLSQVGARLLTNPTIEAAVTAAGGPGRIAEGCKILGAACLVGGVGVVGVVATGQTHHQPAPAAAVRPAARRHGDDQAGAGKPAPTVTSTSVTEPPPAEEPARPRGEGSTGSRRSSSAHKLSDSETPSAASSQEKHTEEEAATEEAFGAFGKRSEAKSSESTASKASSLTATETSSGDEDTTEPAPTPKESAEKKAAGEQFQGALR